MPNEDYAGCDSRSCTDVLAEQEVPLLVVHGMLDTTVAPAESGTLFMEATGPKAAAWLEGCDHQLRARFDEVVALLLDFIPAALADDGGPAKPVDQPSRSVRRLVEDDDSDS